MTVFEARVNKLTVARSESAQQIIDSQQLFLVSQFDGRMTDDLSFSVCDYFFSISSIRIALSFHCHFFSVLCWFHHVGLCTSLSGR